MQNENADRVLGRVLARDLTDRETESVGGGDWGCGAGCPLGTFVSDFLADGTPVCDPDGTQIP